ncbi:hypothetical protein MycrhDRAFT_5831 [Mycolicibacterium rhodesiae JS60]|nr:hypothetical protein MycrhDRAFT_5831 [Mycolicibacterium rhodesiae JS60]
MATTALRCPEHAVNSHNWATVDHVQISGVFRAAARVVNQSATALITSPRWGRIVGLGLTTIRYTGRHSGRIVELPVGYRRKGGTERPGHAVATSDARGRVTVTVRLTS